MATSITPNSRSFPSGQVFYTWVNIRCKYLPGVGQDSVQINSLMTYCEAHAAKKEVAFRRFSLADMRPSAVTDRMAGGDARITDATGHTDGKMVAKVYDRRRERKVRPTR